jgi:hypothetical protein
VNFAVGGLIGFGFGFGLGLGCALAVMYSIYTGGYRKAVEDAARGGTSERYLAALRSAEAKLARK